MKRTVAALLAGTASLAALAIAVPGVASADGPDCSPQARAAVVTQVRPQVQAYVAAHPDLAAEFVKVKALPKDQRKAEVNSYMQAHPDQANDLRSIRQPLRDFRAACHK
jgi:hemophore-related protein